MEISESLELWTWTLTEPYITPNPSRTCRVSTSIYFYFSRSCSAPYVFKKTIQQIPADCFMWIETKLSLSFLKKSTPTDLQHHTLLVGGFNPSEKSEFVSHKNHVPNHQPDRINSWFPFWLKPLISIRIQVLRSYKPQNPPRRKRNCPEEAYETSNPPQKKQNCFSRMFFWI